MIRCRGMKFIDEDDAYEYFRQRRDDEYDADEIEARAEDRQRTADKRAASGISSELLFSKEPA